jgi:glycine cleavage system H protein
MNILGYDYPDDLGYCFERDLWCRAEADGSYTLGVTAFGVHISGDFFMCRPKPVGTVLERGQTMAVVELNKSIVTVRTPLSGVVCRINPLLAERPEAIQHDPYGAGWILCLQPSAWQRERPELVWMDQLQVQATRRIQREPDEGEVVR